MGTLLRKILTSYLILSGIILHFSVAGLYIFNKPFFYKIYTNIDQKVKLTLDPGYLKKEKKAQKLTLAQEIENAFGTWQPLKPSMPIPKGKIKINDKLYNSLKQASSHLKDGQTMFIGEGIYKQGIIIKANNITVIGQGKVVLDGASVEGKGAIVTKGRNITIKNIECRNIKVRDHNGACIRSEGKSLHVEHIYFHNSEQGIISGRSTQLVTIKDSRFEQLGKNGRAHGIYIGAGELVIENSLFIAAKSEAHEIKSRAHTNIINNSIIASMSARDSRLIDISNGGILIINNSILQQGKNSVNGDAIGYGLEKTRYKNNRIKITNSIIILERKVFNRFLHTGKFEFDSKITQNIIISPKDIDITGFNTFYIDRKSAGFKAYPYLPEL